MGLALEEAKKAFSKNEIPVGAVIVKDGEVIGSGHNEKETLKDATLHAEMSAIREASTTLDAWRLIDSTIYVTLEPCIMCMGALIQSRVKRLVFATEDPKAGACGSVYDISNEPRFNHSIEVTKGVLKDEASSILKDFFTKLRSR